MRPSSYATTSRGRLGQGDIYRDIEFVESVVPEGKDVLIITRTYFPLVIVLTQDCDLKQDESMRGSDEDYHDKLLLSVLVAPLYNVEQVLDGTHLLGLEQKMWRIRESKTHRSDLLNNTLPRYHYLDAFPLKVEIPPSVVDFKHYFAVSVEYLRAMRSQYFVCRLRELYREDLNQRFAGFLSRIGLPTVL